MPFQPIKAVAFDMDGVLVDSEIVYLRHQLEVLHPDFPQVRETDLYPTVGMSDAEYRPFLAKLLGFSQHDPEFQRVLAAVSASCTIHFREILRIRVEIYHLCFHSAVIFLSCSLVDVGSCRQIHGETGYREFPGR